MSHDGGSAVHSGQGGPSGHHAGQGHGSGDFSNADILGADVENISWSTLFEGLQVNSGIRFIIVFAAFSCWLYVIYWIRHHEPFSNQVIGVSAPHSPTVDADRSLLARIYKVFPFQTPALASGSFYVPTPGATAPPLLQNNNLGIYNKSFGEATQEKAPILSIYSTNRQIKPFPLIVPSEQNFDQRFGSPTSP